ncbi:hypothetical protein CLG85_002175 [Yangia mangrovi]|uniref:Uncharacterized protein n=1 Tax=Alloyangia mangrovi TaxID=1779329 RepID=A0ABT2KHD3_9RHOB|nr:hypothetical protein [Alloyangia mangrovi]MCT4369217.1 hypothetical protein [Alloyangia mangrovi]
MLFFAKHLAENFAKPGVMQILLQIAWFFCKLLAILPAVVAPASWAADSLAGRYRYTGSCERSRFSFTAGTIPDVTRSG